MDNLFLYPRITREMIDVCGLKTEKYVFTYEYQGQDHGLSQKGTSTIKLIDPLDIWDIESEGLTIDKTIRVAYPELLKGAEGVICKEAELGFGIIWTNKSMPQTGIILPTNDVQNAEGRTCRFHYTFDPGIVSGDLELTVMAFVKKRATNVSADEEDLINEEGVTLGEVERVVLDFNRIYMEFPIEEYRSPDEPLWWVEFSEWEDPKSIDMFSKDSFCLYLNPYYDACPAPAIDGSGRTIKNMDLMVDILAQTYFMIFQRLSEEDLRATRERIGLENNSICSVLNEFLKDCVDIQWSPPENLLKSLQVNIRRRLQQQEEES